MTSPLEKHGFLTMIKGGKTSARYGPKKPIFVQGEPADSIYYIEKGKVKLTVLSRRGKEAVVAILGEGDFMGEACLAGQEKLMATATPLSECRIVRIKKEAAMKALRADPAFSEVFLAHMLVRNIRIQEDLVDQLLLLANYGKESEPNLVIGKISQETLAEMIGTTRSRVSYFMNKFRKLGFIKYNGSLEVHSSLLNVVLHD
jgi:CRP/FNR family transcriptional regulator, cyclic AMP receptor protein